MKDMVMRFGIVQNGKIHYQIYWVNGKKHHQLQWDKWFKITAMNKIEFILRINETL